MRPPRLNLCLGVTVGSLALVIYSVRFFPHVHWRNSAFQGVHWRTGRRHGVPTEANLLSALWGKGDMATKPLDVGV